MVNGCARGVLGVKLLEQLLAGFILATRRDQTVEKYILRRSVATPKSSTADARARTVNAASGALALMSLCTRNRQGVGKTSSI